MFVDLSQVYYWKFKSYTHDNYNYIIKTKWSCFNYKSIYNRRRSTKQARLGFWVDSVLIKREAWTFLFWYKTGCLKSWARALKSLSESRECVIEVYIDNRWLILIIYVNYGRKKFYNIGPEVPSKSSKMMLSWPS